MYFFFFLSPFLILCFQVSLFNYVFLISWAFALPYAKLRRAASSVCTVWTCVIIVCKMLYQLQTIKPENFSVNCSLVSLKIGGAFLTDLKRIMGDIWGRVTTPRTFCLSYKSSYPQQFYSGPVMDLDLLITWESSPLEMDPHPLTPPNSLWSKKPVL